MALKFNGGSANANVSIKDSSAFTSSDDELFLVLFPNLKPTFVELPSNISRSNCSKEACSLPIPNPADLRSKLGLLTPDSYIN